MHVTEVAAFRPQRCAVIPYIGAHHPNGFIDTGNEIDGNRIYISIVGLVEMVRVAGILPKPVPDVRPDLEAANERIAELEAEKADLQGQLDAVDRLVRKETFVKSAKPGRPRKQKEPV